MSIVLLTASVCTFFVACLKKMFMLNNFEGLENNKDKSKSKADEDPSGNVLTDISGENMSNLNKKSGYQNNIKLNPGVINTPNKEQILKQVGPENKIEQEYDKLTSVIKDNDIKSVTNDTKNLILDQKELLDQLKNMTPVVNEAMDRLKSIDLDSLNGMFGNMKNMASELEKNTVSGK
jgi:predicted RND superfamily exporter protein